jgi:hypothetical protein
MVETTDVVEMPKPPKSINKDPTVVVNILNTDVAQIP